MCDYSLHHVASRPAKIEDKLVVTKFGNSITRGFAAVGEPHAAVCLLPGTEVAFEENVECEPSFGIGLLPNKKISQRLARSPDQFGQRHNAPRCARVSGWAGDPAHASVRRSKGDRAAIASRAAHHRGSGRAEARLCRCLVGLLAQFTCSVATSRLYGGDRQIEMGVGSITP